MIVVDGNNDGNAAIKCLGGKKCTFFKQKSQQELSGKFSCADFFHDILQLSNFDSKTISVLFFLDKL